MLQCAQVNSRPRGAIDLSFCGSGHRRTMSVQEQRIDDLEKELETTRMERNKLHAELVDRRLLALETQNGDHEKRIRAVEEVATKFNFLMALSIGGGALSAIVLIRTLLGL